MKRIAACRGRPWRVAWLCLASILLASPARAQLPRAHLLAPDTLAAWLARGVPHRLLDVRTDPFAYLAGHLPGAAYVNIEALRGVRGGVPLQLHGAARYREVFADLGVAFDRPVVVYGYGESKNIDATFVTWLLQAMGHRQVHLLDGGFSRWQFEQRPLDQRYPRGARAAGWERRRFAPAVVTLDEVRARLGDGRTLFVDARPPEQFAGEQGSQRRRGHLPGAVNHYWQDDLETRGFGRVLRDSAALAAAYRAQGITPDRDLVLYCNSATEASHLHFVLVSLLGYPRVRLYPGSWTEWAEREDTPVATGP